LGQRGVAIELAEPAGLPELKPGDLRPFDEGALVKREVVHAPRDEVPVDRDLHGAGVTLMAHRGGYQSTRRALAGTSTGRCSCGWPEQAG
jgi:hypothetical protein